MVTFLKRKFLMVLLISGILLLGIFPIQTVLSVPFTNVPSANVNSAPDFIPTMNIPPNVDTNHNGIVDSLDQEIATRSVAISWSRLSTIPLWLVSTFGGIFMVGMKSGAEFTLAEGTLVNGTERTVWIGKIPNSRIPEISKTIKNFLFKKVTMPSITIGCCPYKILGRWYLQLCRFVA